ncbi:glycosyltransferase [Gammaproteobacteria bacterium]|nr:glycosyltransferase [Gammaproteobacteria bacterium]
MKKNLLYIAPADSAHSNRWLRAFLEEYDVIWITFHKPRDDIKSENIKVFYLRNNFYFLYDYCKLLKELLFKKIHVLQVHSLARYLIIPFFLFLLRGDVKVAAAWGSDIYFPSFGKTQKFLQYLVLKRFNYITADSVQMLSALSELGADDLKLKRINFGIEINTFLPLEKHELSQSILEKYSLDPKNKYAISLRNLYPIYDIDTLIRSIKLVIDRGLDYKFIIGGDGPEKENLIKLIDRLDISQHIQFLGRYNHSDLPFILNACNLYISTSKSDAGIASSTAEAMACGLPCIISNNSENALWIEDGISGFLFNTGDENELSSKIIQSIKLSDEDIAKINNRARSKILNENDYNNEMNKVLKLYEQ